jgi:hypothetical protein
VERDEWRIQASSCNAQSVASASPIDRVLPPLHAMRALIRIGRPRLVFEGDFSATALHSSYDVTAKSDRFLIIQNGPPPSIVQLQLVVNWLAEVARVLPRGTS